MPWKETGPVFERVRFIDDYLSGCYTITELALMYNVSRKTLYKWLTRHDREGISGLQDRSRAPVRHASIDEDVRREIIQFRRRFPFMGPRKIVARLRELRPKAVWPAASTVGDLLKREGLVSTRRRQRTPVHPLRAIPKPAEPNDVMTIDFKGQFKLGNRSYCYPLTIVDAFSRYILACEALSSNEYEPTRRIFERVFHTYGLPRVILSDNGSPFGSPGLGRLSRLSVWWIQLGIAVQRIVPGHPEQNGAHERMHRTLKEQTARPPAATATAQQRRFDRFRREFNEERPHEALGQRRPSTIYSSRAYPEQLPQLEYPGHFETRRVDHAGQIKWKDKPIFLSHTLTHETVGFEEIDDAIWSLYYGPVMLARFNARAGRFFT
jgi:transposase InsO family protein